MTVRVVFFIFSFFITCLCFAQVSRQSPYITPQLDLGLPDFALSGTYRPFVPDNYFNFQEPLPLKRPISVYDLPRKQGTLVKDLPRKKRSNRFKKRKRRKNRRLREEVKKMNENLGDIPTGPGYKIVCTPFLEFEPVLQTSPEISSGKTWHPGCEVLEKADLNNAKEGLSQCLVSLKRAVLNGSSARGINHRTLYRNMFDKLNNDEQNFLASIITAHGEAGVLTPPIHEMSFIMKVLENRARYGRRNHKCANMLDVALQKVQFSMYNAGAHHFRRAFAASPSDKITERAIDAFILFKKGHFTSDKRLNNVYHYHASNVFPDWRSSRRRASLTLNRQAVKSGGGIHHKFYANINWTFRYTPERRASLITKSCE